MRKGKVNYFVVVEKEIEIPDEIVAIQEKNWDDTSLEELQKVDDFISVTWAKIKMQDENFLEPSGIYYEDNNDWWVICEE